MNDATASGIPKPLSIWLAVCFGLLFVIVQTLVVIGFGQGAVALLGSGGMADTLTLAVGVPLAFGVVAALLVLWRGLTAGVFRWEQRFALLIPIGLILVFATGYLVDFGIALWPTSDDLAEGYEETIGEVMGGPVWAIAISGVIFGPIFEEIIFRGVILEGLSRKYRPIVAILVSSLIFAVIHASLLQVITTFFAGLVLGWIYLRTRSLIIVSLLHMAPNALAFRLLGLQLDTGTDPVPDTGGTQSGYAATEVLFYSGLLGVAALLSVTSFLLFRKISDR